MFVKDIFVKDINRNIQSVIKVSQDDYMTELEEYVVTNELFDYIRTFSKEYYRTCINGYDSIGFLVSGFYGSGKSHFLKILYYILKNIGVDILINNNRCLEDISSEIRKIAELPKDVIIFNIDSKNHREECMLDVFSNEFNAMRGYSPYHGFISNMEENLHDEGYLHRFKSEFQKDTGCVWEDAREEFYFYRDNIISILSSIRGIDLDTSEEYFSSIEKNYKMNIESFAQKVKKYIDTREENYSVVFMVDEVSQFIAGDNSKMLNLQTIVEELSTKCNGRAFVILTTHVDIHNMINNEKYDFSKIQGRFKNRFHLSSINIGEVLSKRLLLKKSGSREFIEKFYDNKKFFINTKLKFDFISTHPSGVVDRDNFIEYYPFPTYQIDLLREVILYMTKNNVVSDDISKGERNIIGCFHRVLMDFKDHEINHIVPFYMFYDAISDFIDYNHKYIFSILKDYTILDKFDINILKTLFLIKYIPNINSNIDTITSLMVIDIDQERDMINSVNNSLVKLINEGFVNRDGDKFYFLSKNERDINYKIIRNSITSYEVKDFLCSEIFGRVFNLSKVKYRNNYSFSINQILDDFEYKFSSENLIGIKILMTNYDENFNLDSIRVLSTIESNIIMYLDNDKTLLEESSLYLKLDKFLKYNKNNYKDKFLNIILQKEVELKNRLDRVRTIIDSSIRSSFIFINGERISRAYLNVEDLFKDSFNNLISCKFNKLSYINKSIGSYKKVFDTISDEGLCKEFYNDNLLSIREIHNFVDSSRTVKLNEVILHFRHMPYGFNKFDTLFGVMYLIHKNMIECNYDMDHLNEIVSLKGNLSGVILSAKNVFDREKFISYKEMLEDVFNKKYFVDSFEELQERSKGDFKDIECRIDKIEGISNRNLDYPGREFIKEFRDFVNYIKYTLNVDYKDGVYKFDKFEIIYKFYTSVQFDIFNDGLKSIKVFNRDKNFIDKDSIIHGVIDDIRKIVMSKNPYRDIVKLKGYVGKFVELHGKYLKDVIYKVGRFLEEDIYSFIDNELYNELKEKLYNCNILFDVYGIKMEGIFLKDKEVRDE